MLSPIVIIFHYLLYPVKMIVNHHVYGSEAAILFSDHLSIGCSFMHTN